VKNKELTKHKTKLQQLTADISNTLDL